MNTSFTPGPWLLADPFFDGTLQIVSERLCREICEIPPTTEEDEFSDESEANARLIAQSPRLLEELDALTGELERLGFDDMPGDTMADLRNRFDSARAAINLATGQEP